MKSKRPMMFLTLLTAVLLGGVLTALTLRLAAADSDPPAPASPAETGDVAVPYFTGYSYQGYIEKNNQPYTGSCDFRFVVNELPSVQQSFNNVPVRAGHFSVVLNTARINEYNGLFSLDISAACPSGSGLMPMPPSQPVMAVPYANALVPDSIQRSSNSGGCALLTRNVREDIAVLLACDGRGLREGAGGGGEPTIIVGGTDFESNTTIINGLDVFGTYRGLLTRHTAIGFDIQDTGGLGGIIRRAGLDGLFIDRAKRYGLHIASSGQSAVTVLNAGWQGIYVEGSKNYDGVFVGNVYVGGACTGCALANIAQNAGATPLEPGTLVTVVGVAENGPDGVPLVLRVRPAQPGEPVIGVVVSAAAAEPTPESAPAEPDATRAAESGAPPATSLVPQAGSAAPGGYLTVVRDGVVRVRLAPADAAAVQPGMRLGAAGATAAALPADQPAHDAQPATAIGTALSAPDADGYAWVMITLR